MIGGNMQVDVLQRVICSVPRIQVGHLDAYAHYASLPFSTPRLVT